MGRKSYLSSGCISVLLPLLFILPSFSLVKVEPELTSETIESLQNLPHGIGNQSSLLIRTKHVDSVGFSGGGAFSQYGYTHVEGVAQTGLWLRLINKGSSWSSGSISFRKAFDLSRYNSAVIWARSLQPGQKIMLILQDSNWVQGDTPQAISAPFPSQGFPKNQIVQLVIPFSSIKANKGIDYSSIQRVGFEFGHKTAGNALTNEIEIIGVSFVSQTEELSGPVLVGLKGTDSQKTVQADAPPPVVAARKAPEAKPVIKKAEENVKVIQLAAQKKEPSAPLPPPAHEKNVVRTIQAPLLQKPVAAKAPVVQQTGTVSGIKPVVAPAAPAIAAPAGAAPAMNVLPKSLRVDAFTPVLLGLKDDVEKIRTAVSSAVMQMVNRIHWRLVGIVAALLAALLGLVFLARFLKTSFSSEWTLEKVIHEIRWPHTLDGESSHAREQKKFWRELSLMGVKQGWLSPFQASFDKPSSTAEPSSGSLSTGSAEPSQKESSLEEYRGEMFLYRQRGFAEQAGVEMIPSFCFVRTLFHYETFLANPKLYLIKHVPVSDRHFSDEELRIKNIGFFPVWIPPFWQKQHELPERVLVPYGKLPGVMVSNDSIQFNLATPELRTFAISVLERCAARADAVRIEGAAAMLNSFIRRYWRGSIPSIRAVQRTEFWTDVIGAVKEKFPKFVMIADGAGSEGQKLLELGFDRFENNHLRDIIVNQIRLESVGNLVNALQGEAVPFLDKSIYNLTPLTSSEQFVVEMSRKQNLLCCYVLALLPGNISIDNRIPHDLDEFLKIVSKLPVIKRGRFSLLQTSSTSVMGIARWDQQVLSVAVVNFSMTQQDLSVRFDPVQSGFSDKKLYLFSDMLHGTPFRRNLPASSSDKPAITVLGEDLRESGLTLTLPPLGIKMVSVPMSSPIHDEPSSELRQVHKA